MYNQLIPEQRSQIFALLQNKTEKKVIASIVGKRFGDWEMDTIIGKNGKGAILTLTERSTNFLIACKLKHGKNANECAKAAVAQLFAYRDQIFSITTDNGSEFCAHEMITAKIQEK